VANHWRDSKAPIVMPETTPGPSPSNLARLVVEAPRKLALYRMRKRDIRMRKRDIGEVGHA
jgi:hypothetical protein